MRYSNTCVWSNGNIRLVHLCNATRVVIRRQDDGRFITEFNTVVGKLMKSVNFSQPGFVYVGMMSNFKMNVDAKQG